MCNACPDTSDLMKRQVHPAFALMVAIAVKVGRPTMHEADLYVHDARTLREWDVSVPFVWGLARTATMLYRTDKRDGDTSFSQDLARSMAEYGMQSEETDNTPFPPTYKPIPETRAMLFAWDGTSLKSITQEECASLLMGRK